MYSFPIPKPCRSPWTRRFGPSTNPNASDGDASEATETHRTWLATHSQSPPFHPASDKANDLLPVYRFWNRTNRNYLLGDAAGIDLVTGRYPTSRPIGHVGEAGSKLIALDTSVFFATADPAAAIEQGLINMGLDSTAASSWVETDTLQMLNHEVAPHGQALRCNDCHGAKEDKDFDEIHEKHIKDEDFDCSWCHGFSRPERSLTPSALLFFDDFETAGTHAWSQ